MPLDRRIARSDAIALGMVAEVRTARNRDLGHIWTRVAVANHWARDVQPLPEAKPPAG
jgi:hypothetical protein